MILITGATGNNGGQTIKTLNRRCQTDACALVQSPEKEELVAALGAYKRSGHNASSTSTVEQVLGRKPTPYVDAIRTSAPTT